MLYWYECVLLYITSCLVHSYGVDPSCECVVFQSNGLSKGLFQSPDYPDPYKAGLNCILYTFIGDLNEIVEIKFIDMDLKRPEHRTPTQSVCTDRLRIYKNLDRPEINEHTQWDDELCGNMSNMEEKNFFSVGRGLVLEFHTDPYSKEEHIGFKGTFEFVDQSTFKTDGIHQFTTSCSYHMQSSIDRYRYGDFYSPSYPQKYPALSRCEYMFMAQSREKVKLSFNIIRLHSHTSRHPFGCDGSGDTIKVYDSNSCNKTEPIATFCGSDDKQDVYSTGQNMCVLFESDKRREKQGFHATYQFIANWKEPPPSNDGGDKGSKHTASCDKTIISSRGTNSKTGTIDSPNYPNSYPSSTRCQYEFEAEDKEERIQLTFSVMNLYYGGRGDHPNDCKEEQGDKITVIIYINNEEITLGTYCAQGMPPVLMSNGPRMKVIFESASGPKDGTSRFKMGYTFRTDFGVKGNGVQDMRKNCSFTYNSTRRAKGTFTSPNYEGMYPRGCECNYKFHGKKGERVNITFETFDLYDDNGCESSDKSDSVSFSNFLSTDDRKMPRFCGQKRPSQTHISSDAAFFQVKFKSNNIYDAKGFLGKYEFKPIVPYDVVSPEPTKQEESNTAAQASVRTDLLILFLFCQTVIFQVL